MAPQTHTRYRVQHLIRLGEWLERNQAALITAFDAIEDAHDLLIDSEDSGMSDSEVIEHVGFKQMPAVQSLQKLVQELRFNVPVRDVQRGRDVTLHHPFAHGDKEYEVVIKAPQPEGVPSQEEFDKVRSEVDGV